MESQELWVRVLRNNWHLISLLVLIVAAAVGMSMRGDNADTATAATDSSDAVVAVNLSQDDPVRTRWAQATKDQKVEEAIAHYEHELKHNRGSSETPANLYRLANLYYSNLQDYENASLYYEALIQEYPDYKGLQTVYPNLVVCYERMGKHELTRNTYKRMMEYFPQHTQEYAFAKQALGL